MSFLQRLSEIIPHFRVFEQYSDTHILILIDIRTLLSLNIVNWKRNRPPEMDRCIEIAKDMVIHKPIIDSMFYMHMVDDERCDYKFECLDGIHRYNAIHWLHKENTKPLDLLEASSTPIDTSIDWLYDRTVLLNARTGCTEDELTVIFRNINNCVPVPITYLQEYDERKRKCAETIAFELQSKYRSHFVVEKTAQFKPNRPNTTHNRAVNMITELYDGLRDKESEDVDLTSTIRKLIENANLYIQNHLTMGISKGMLEKCRKTGCYLFLYKSAEILRIIERLRNYTIIV